MWTNYCLYCDEIYEQPIGWQTLISRQEGTGLCPQCEGQLAPLQGILCTICGRELEGEGLCTDCQRWESDPKWRGILRQNRSLYAYNAFLKDILARFKYRGDYQLAQLFAEQIRETVSEPYPLIVPIPLSEQRQVERGFNQAEAIGRLARLPISLILTRIHTEKQAKKSRQARLDSPQVFSLQHPLSPNQNILLLDDIYTTGMTLRHAAHLLREAGANQIDSLTIAR